MMALGRLFSCMLVSTLHFIVSVATSCINPSEPFPAPNVKPENQDVQSYFSGLEAGIAEILSGGKAPWNTTITSFAIEVTTADNPLWYSYHTAPVLGKYPDSKTTKVNGKKAFRIASISKVFTVLALLLQQQEGKLSIKDPVSKYIPELVEGLNEGGVQWDEISLESLASQLSGVPRECTSSSCTLPGRLPLITCR